MRLLRKRLRLTKFQSVRALMKELRDACPAVAPVRFRRRRLHDCLAYVSASYHEDKNIRWFNLVVDDRLSWTALWPLLVHEYAHCLAWQEQPEDGADAVGVSDHGPEWALAYARCYQDVIEP